MKDLFGRDKSVISRHLRNIYIEGELQREATVANYATVQIENGRQVLRTLPRSVPDYRRHGLSSWRFAEGPWKETLRFFKNGDASEEVRDRRLMVLYV